MSAQTEAQLIRCPNCGATNRVPPKKEGQPVCGRCKSPLLAAAHPVTVTDANFAREVEQSSLPVLLDMWAPWCGPCRMIAPVLEDLAARHAGRLKIVKVNVDEEPALGARFRAQSIPLLVVLRDGREVDRIVGALRRPALEARLEPHLAGAPR